MSRLGMLITAGSVLLLAPATGAQLEIPSPDDVLAAIGQLGAVPIPENNPLTRAKVQLGQRLFEDPGRRARAARAWQSRARADRR